MVQISALAGSGKTVLVRSWIAEAGLAGRVAWAAAGRDERDPRRFWVGVADALRGTAAGAALVRPLTAAPDLDGWAAVERLLTDLAPLADRLWLVIDDVRPAANREDHAMPAHRGGCEAGPVRARRATRAWRMHAGGVGAPDPEGRS